MGPDEHRLALRPLFQTIPTHMGAWSKYVLGWIDPKVLDYGSRHRNVSSARPRPPAGTEAAVKINLPDKVVDVGEPHSGENAWWTGHDQDDADVRLTRSIDVPTGGPTSASGSGTTTCIEECWDYGFIEVSTDGGTTWEQLEVRDEAGDVVSTDEDPNGNLQGDFGGMENGLTGDTGGYRHDYVDLTPYAGSTIQCGCGT